MLTAGEQRVMRVFRQFLMDPGQMLCFSGPTLKQHRTALRQLTERDLLVQERFDGGYSLTKEGYDAMKSCKPAK